MVCVICNKSLGNDIVVVRKKGLATLIKFSHLRNDGLFKIFGSVEDIILHTKCRKKYLKQISKRQQKLLELKAAAAEDTAGTSSNSETEFTFKDFNEKFVLFAQTMLVCVICNKSLGNDIVVVRKKGLATLIKFSHLRNDGLFKIFGSVEDIILHTKCRKKYLKQISKRQQKLLELKAAAAEDTAGTSSNSETEFTFKDFKEKCFICAKEIADENMRSSKNGQLCYYIRSENTKQTLIAALKKNQESVRSQKILQRIENVQLECVQARYHKHCYGSVMSPKRNQKRGRPESNYVASAMQIIFDFIEQSKKSQFSFNEFKNILTDYVPDARTIIKKLYEKFGDNIFVTNSPGESSIITFKASLDDIVIDSWYLQKDKNCIHEDDLRIVKKAAEIIREDIILTKAYDKTRENAKEDVPQSLELYLKTLAGPRTTTETVDKTLLSIAHKLIQVYQMFQ